MKGFMRKTAFAMSLVMALNVGVVNALAATSTDIGGHWAEDTIAQWQNAGRINGYEDGTFKPNNGVTRAELVRMINRAAGLTDAGTSSFSDVASSDWFANDVAIAVNAGYANGMGDGTFAPDTFVTRAQAAKFIASAAKLTENSSGASSMSDYSSIPSWAVGSVGALIEGGFMNGYPDGSFGPGNGMTRAEAVVTLDRVFLGGAIDDAKGSDYTIEKSDTKLSDETIEGDLIIAESVANGTVTLSNVTVKGDVIVKGGGSNSVYLISCDIDGNIIVEKDGVRVVLDGSTEAAGITINKASKIQTASGFTGDPMDIVISGVASGDTIELAGKFGNVTINDRCSLRLTGSSSVSSITVSEDADNTRIYISSESKVGTVVSNGITAITGNGDISKWEINVSGCESTIRPDSTVVADKASNPTYNTSSGGGGGGGGSSSTDRSYDARVRSVSVITSAGEQALTLETISSSGSDYVYNATGSVSGAIGSNPADYIKVVTMSNKAVVDYHNFNVSPNKVVTGTISVVSSDNTAHSRVDVEFTLTDGTVPDVTISGNSATIHKEGTYNLAEQKFADVQEITIAESVGDGTVTLENGDISILNVNGGGSNSVHLNNMKAGTVNLSKTGVRLTVDTVSVINLLGVGNQAILEIFGNVDTVNVLNTAENTTLTVGATATINSLFTNAVTAIDGEGKIETLINKAAGTTITPGVDVADATQSDVPPEVVGLNIKLSSLTINTTSATNAEFQTTTLELGSVTFDDNGNGTYGSEVELDLSNTSDLEFNIALDAANSDVKVVTVAKSEVTLGKLILTIEFKKDASASDVIKTYKLTIPFKK